MAFAPVNWLLTHIERLKDHDVVPAKVTVRGHSTPGLGATLTITARRKYVYATLTPDETASLLAPLLEHSDPHGRANAIAAYFVSLTDSAALELLTVLLAARAAKEAQSDNQNVKRVP